MYAYTARVGSSCQHIRASCRQCATSRLRSIAPRLLPQSSLLSPNIPLFVRSYASSEDPLAAWLASVKNKKSSAEEKKVLETKTSKPAHKKSSEPQQDRNRRRKTSKARARPERAVKPAEPKEADLVQALKIIADALAKSKGKDSSKSTSKPNAQAEDKDDKRRWAKQEKIDRAKATGSGTRSIKDLLERDAAILEVAPNTLAAALGASSAAKHGELEETKVSEPVDGRTPNRREARTKKRLEREKKAGKKAAEESADQEEPNSTLSDIVAGKGWKGVVDEATDVKVRKVAPKDKPRSKVPTEREVAKEKAREMNAQRERVRRVASTTRVAKPPVIISRPQTTSGARSIGRPTGPLLQKLYDITHSVATTQAQRLMLQWLEANRDLLGEHGDALIEAQRDMAMFNPETGISIAGAGKLQSTLLSTYQSLEDAMKPKPATKQSIPKMELNKKESVKGEIITADLKLKPIDVPQPPVPGVVYGLDRVLFNPGVYQLRDEHSKVYNFDPYLETITPVKEFDFSALKEYITSSRDTALINIAAQEKTKYTGSTSSMTSALAHFHYLLSKWRPINMNHLSRGFPDPLTSFSAFQREPTGIFLRWRDGVYAIDANKEFDSANVLMYLGKSMEKFLTEEKEVYEKFRKDQSHTLSPEDKDTPESYHYTTMGDFLMRSQLDAYDPRLPGTGMFDLKTRAVVSIRKDATDFEPGLGYEIRKRKGEFESFEREYYDLCRAAFMKYSLQARMGRMDGIFVAFHNIERIFGFQYLPIGAMDEAIHGATDTTLGDQEFKVSVSMLNKALDMFTEKFPGQSLQIDFETRPLNAKKDDCFMYIIAQPVTEEKIKSIQERNLEKIQEYERQVVGLDSKQTAQFLIDAVNKETEDAELMDDAERLEKAIERPFEPRNVEILKAAVEKMSVHDTATENAVHKALEMVEARLQEEGEVDAVVPTEGEAAEETSETNEELASTIEPEKELNPDAETKATDEALATAEESSTSSSAKVEKPAKKSKAAQTFESHPLMGLKLQIRNFVNGQEVLRVENLRKQDEWTVKYGIEIMKYEQAAGRYQQMKARKYLVHVGRKQKSLKDLEKGRPNAHQDQFLGAIADAVKAGKEFRAEQDALDAEKGIKSLADTESVFEPVRADEVEIRSDGLKVEETEKPDKVEEAVVPKEAQEPATVPVTPEVMQEKPKEEVNETKAEVQKPKEAARPEAEEKAKPEAKKEESKPAEEKPWWLL